MGERVTVAPPAGDVRDLGGDLRPDAPGGGETPAVLEEAEPFEAAAPVGSVRAAPDGAGGRRGRGGGFGRVSRGGGNCFVDEEDGNGLAGVGGVG